MNLYFVRANGPNQKTTPTTSFFRIGIVLLFNRAFIVLGILATADTGKEWKKVQLGFAVATILASIGSLNYILTWAVGVSALHLLQSLDVKI